MTRRRTVSTAWGREVRTGPPPAPFLRPASAPEPLDVLTSEVRALRDDVTDVADRLVSMEATLAALAADVAVLVSDVVAVSPEVTG